MLWPQEKGSTFMSLQNEPLIGKAVEVARELHKKQFRKSTKIPYFEHLASVACLIKLHGGDTNQIIAGLLHDSVEDQGGKITFDDIKKDFGICVSEIIKDCTFEESDEPYRVHKARGIEKVRNGINHFSYLVIICDKLHNAESIIKDYVVCGNTLWDRFNGGKEDVIWYYTEMYKAIRHSCPYRNFPILDRLERAVEVMNSFKE